MKTFIILAIAGLTQIALFSLYNHELSATDATTKLQLILKNNNVPMHDNLIVIPDWVQHIKIDVGLSYNAPITQKWLDHENNLLVFAFEPNPAAVARLKSTRNIIESTHETALQHRFINDKVFIIPVALGAKNTTADFYITNSDIGCSSLHKPKAWFYKVRDTIKVDVFRLETFLNTIPWQKVPYIEYLKVDAQGHDLEIIKGLGDYISKFVYITLEAESKQYFGCQKNNLANITAYMASKNFVLVKHPNTSDPTFLNQSLASKANVYIQQ